MNLTTKVKNRPYCIRLAALLNNSWKDHNTIEKADVFNKPVYPSNCYINSNPLRHLL